MELLKLASQRDMVIIEDDYEFETNYVNEPCPALKSLDDEGRVIYVGSLSKTLFPGLRLGFMVGPKTLIAEARALRRLMVRHAPNNNQRTAALFLSLGHHDTLIRRLHRAYRSRWEVMGAALNAHMPNASRIPSFGGTSFWVKGPQGLDSEDLARAAAAKRHPHRARAHQLRRGQAAAQSLPPRLLVHRRGEDRAGRAPARGPRPGRRPRLRPRMDDLRWRPFRPSRPRAKCSRHGRRHP